MAKGYTITRGKLSPLSTVKLLVFITIYLIAHIITLVWELALFDPGTLFLDIFTEIVTVSDKFFLPASITVIVSVLMPKTFTAFS